MTDLHTAARYDFHNPKPLPDDYPVFDIDPISVAFSTLEGPKYYLSYYEGQCFLVDRRWTDIASSLFFRGGKVEDFGLKLRDGLDKRKVMMCLRALLGSFGPKHEEKEATVGFAISKWFEDAPKPQMPHQAQRKKGRRK